MSRSVQWQRTPSDAVSWHQDQALSSTIYILREVGPTSFLLKEDGETKKFKVALGDPHSCGCPVFKKEREPCKHICWVLLKRFKLERRNELSYQLGLVEREINQVLRNPLKSGAPSSRQPPKETGDDTDSESGGREELGQRPLTQDDVCPICQDQLLSKHQPVTYCRRGCGNSVHIKCMKVWADHQRQSTGASTVMCPFCREDFGSPAMLALEYRNTLQEGRAADRLDQHVGTACQGCKMSPIKGKCYQCVSCQSLHLCNSCYHGRRHMQHEFVFRLKKTQRWRPAPSRDRFQNQSAETLLGPIASDLQSREITEDDYDVLLRLDGLDQGPEVPVDLAGLPEHLINRIPTMRVKPGSRLLAPGRQCRLCLRAYEAGQLAKKLPDCGHIFHRTCIDHWLRDDHRRCPIDRSLVFDPASSSSFATGDERKTDGAHQERREEQEASDLVVPGVGLIRVSSLGSTSKAARKAGNLRRRPVHIAKAKPSPTANKLSDVTLSDLLIQADAFSLARSRTSLHPDDKHGRESHRVSEIEVVRTVMTREGDRRLARHAPFMGDTCTDENPILVPIPKHPLEDVHPHDPGLAVSGMKFKKSSAPNVPPQRSRATEAESRDARGRIMGGASRLPANRIGEDHCLRHCRREGTITSAVAEDGHHVSLGPKKHFAGSNVVVTNQREHKFPKLKGSRKKPEADISEKLRKRSNYPKREKLLTDSGNPWALAEDGRVVLNTSDVIEGLTGVHLSRNITSHGEEHLLDSEASSRWCRSAPSLTRHNHHVLNF